MTTTEICFSGLTNGMESSLSNPTDATQPTTNLTVDPNRTEVFIDICDICYYFKRKAAKVRWCTWTENQQKLFAIFCKPCFNIFNSGVNNE